MAELAVGQPAWRHLVIRSDLLGQDVTPTDLEGSATPSVNNFADSRARLTEIDDNWRTSSNGWGVLRGLSTAVFLGLPELEAERAVPMFVTAHAPAFSPGHKDLLLGMITRLSRLDDLDRKLGDLSHITDIAEVVGLAMRQANLHCSEPSDRVYAGLLFLYARHLGAPEFARFYGECLQRYIDHRTIRIAHYREMRDMLTMRAWWVFADATEDSPTRQIPRWALCP